MIYCRGETVEGIVVYRRVFGDPSAVERPTTEQWTEWMYSVVDVVDRAGAVG